MRAARWKLAEWAPARTWPRYPSWERAWQSASGFAARMFGCLSDSGINIEMIATSDIRITCIIERDRVKEALGVLHSAFELDRDA